jgi:hypothetical protein
MDLRFVRPSIRKAHPFDALQERFGAHLVVHAKVDAVIKAELNSVTWHCRRRASHLW